MNAPPPLGYHLHLSRPTVNKSPPLLSRLNPFIPLPLEWVLRIECWFRGQHVENSNARGVGVPLLAWDAQSNARAPRLLFLVDGMLAVGDRDACHSGPDRPKCSM